VAADETFVTTTRQKVEPLIISKEGRWIQQSRDNKVKLASSGRVLAVVVSLGGLALVLSYVGKAMLHA